MRPNSYSIQAPTWRVDRGKLAATQAFKLSSCAALIKPALPPISKLVRPSIPPCSKSLRQPRIVSSSSNNALATSRQLHPSSKSTRAFARRVIRLAAAPSRANAISLLRSSSPRKPPRIMPPSESDQQRNARNFPEPSMSRGILLQTGVAFLDGTERRRWQGAESTMSTTPQFEVPTDLRKVTEQSIEQVEKWN